MSFYPAKGGNGNAYTAESFYLAVDGTKTVALAANANAIYIMSDLRDAYVPMTNINAEIIK